MIEGIGCVLAGLWGTGTGTTSYSENIGAIGITKVSRTKEDRLHLVEYCLTVRFTLKCII